MFQSEVRRPTGGPTNTKSTKATEYLHITLQLQRVVLRAPAKVVSTTLLRSESGIRYFLYTKWVRGAATKGKLVPVAMSGDNARRPRPPTDSGIRQAGNALKQLEVVFPSTHQISFSVGMHLKNKSEKASSGIHTVTTFEKKTLEVEFWYLKKKTCGESVAELQRQQDFHGATRDQSDSDSRIFAGAAVVDLRELLVGDVRVGGTNRIRFDLARNGDFLDVEYVVNAGAPTGSGGDSDCSSWATASNSSTASSRMGSCASDMQSLASECSGCGDVLRSKKKKKTPLSLVSSLVGSVSLPGKRKKKRAENPSLRPDCSSAREALTESDDMSQSAAASASERESLAPHDPHGTASLAMGMPVLPSLEHAAELDPAVGGTGDAAWMGSTDDQPLRAEDFPFTPAASRGPGRGAPGAWVEECGEFLREIAARHGHGLIPGKEKNSGQKYAFSGLGPIGCGGSNSTGAATSSRSIVSADGGDTRTLYARLFERGPHQRVGTRTLTNVAGSCLARLHATRGDLGYPATAALAPSPDAPHAAYASTTYRMKLSSSKFLDTQEYLIAVAAGDHFVLHSLNVIPTAPVVGDSVRLEVVIHIAEAVVEVFVYPCLTSGRVKFLFGSAVKEHTEKIANQLECVVTAMLKSNRSSTRRSTRLAMRDSGLRKARASLPQSLSSSLDPNLWRRLNDHKTLPYQQLVLIILRRLQMLPPPATVTPPQIQTIENVIGYYRHSEEVVNEALHLLLLYTRNVRVEQLISCSPTFPSTVTAVTALLPRAQFGVNIERFLLLVKEAGAAHKAKRLREMAASRNPWYILGSNIGDVSIVVATLAELARCRAVVMNEAQVGLLRAALCLHLHSLDVCLNVMSILEHNQRRNPHMEALRQVNSGFLLAIRRAAASHSVVRQNIAARPELDAVLRQREAELTRFNKALTEEIPECPQFQCDVLLLHVSPTGGSPKATSLPLWPVGGEPHVLYVTASWICVGGHFMSLSEVASLHPYRWWLKPCLHIRGQDHSGCAVSRLEFGGGGNGASSIDIVVWQREKLVAHLKSVTGLCL